MMQALFYDESKWRRRSARRDRRITSKAAAPPRRKVPTTTVAAARMMMLLSFMMLLLLPAHPPSVDAFSPAVLQQNHKRRHQHHIVMKNDLLKAQSTKELETTTRRRRTLRATRERDEYSLFDSRNTESVFVFPLERPDRNTEMMGSAALAFSSFIIYGLAMSDKVLMRGLEREGLQETADTILNVVVPMSSADVVAVALGEAFAGVFSAAVWLVISSFLDMKRRVDERKAGGSLSSSALPSSYCGVNNAVADGDFFVTKAATYPVFQGLGFSPVAAGIASVLVALIPYEIVKFASRRRLLLEEEDLELELRLQQQQQKERQREIAQPLGFLTEMVANVPGKRPDGPLSPERFTSTATTATTTASSVELKSLVPVLQQKESFFVETFADIVKWLEYTVLSKQYGGELGLYPVVEGALFGTLCAVSSQMYTDLLYIGFGIQGEAKRQQLLSRTATEWSAVYLYRCISVSTLFGVYQLVQFPVQMFIAALLTGSLDSCIGSDDFVLCQETFEYFNPLDRASIVTEVRALAVQLLALWDRIATVLNV